MNHSLVFKNILFIFFLTLSSILSVPIGQHFILTLPENATEKSLGSWLEQTKPAGVMLLSSHFTNREKTKKLTSFLQNKAKELELPPLFIAVDWEGGIVSRPNETGGFFSVPSPWALCNAGKNSCFLAGMLIGHQLRSIGVNMDFAPSLDLFDSKNQILATRCFSAYPNITAECGIAFAKGLLSQGVLPVIKHFPGLGIGKYDTHCAEVGIEIDENEFNKITVPFKKALEEKIPCIMSTHASFKQFDNIPATLSSKAVHFLTSKSSDTLLITDDFCMNAVQNNRPLEESILKSLAAGYHLIIFSGKPEKQISMMQKLQDNNLIDSKILDTNFINKFKEKYFTKKVAIDIKNEDALAHELAKRCLAKNKLVLSLNDKNILMFSVNLPKIRTSEKWFIQDEHSFFGTNLKNLGLNLSEIILDPLDEKSTSQIDEILSKVQSNSYILLQTFFFADSKWNKIQTQWLEKFKNHQDKLIIISLGHTYEKTILSKAQILNLGSFHKPLLERAAYILTNTPQLTGADELVKNLSKYLEGKNFGLLCHKASMVISDNSLKFLPNVLYEYTRDKNSKAHLAAIFSPEHGLFGSQEAGALVDSQAKSLWECPIYSLHGKNKKPTPEMLKNLDLIVIDLQEIGVRCFTYLSTLQLMLQAAQELQIPVIVLDRPNPLIVLGAHGPMLEKKHESFLGKIYTKFLHGSTIGSLAKQINTDIGAQLTVIPCSTNSSNLFFEREFISPSPNLKSIDHIYAYPITVFTEGTNYSEGRGTDYPFLQIGAPWVDEKLLAKTLNDKKFMGIYFEPVKFAPMKMLGIADNPKHSNKLCHGVFLHIYDLQNLKPTKISKAILQTLFSLYPEKSEFLCFQNRYNLDLLVGKDSWRKKILAMKEKI